MAQKPRRPCRSRGRRPSAPARAGPRRSAPIHADPRRPPPVASQPVLQFSLRGRHGSLPRAPV